MGENLLLRLSIYKFQGAAKLKHHIKMAPKNHTTCAMRIPLTEVFRTLSLAIFCLLLFHSCVFLSLRPDLTHLAKEKTKADAEFYRWSKEAEANKVGDRTRHCHIFYCLSLFHAIVAYVVLSSFFASYYYCLFQSNDGSAA